MADQPGLSQDPKLFSALQRKNHYIPMLRVELDSTEQLAGQNVVTQTAQKTTFK